MDSTQEGSLSVRLSDGASPVGSWVSMASPTAAELVAGLGFDFLVVDTEHAPLSTETVAELLRAVDAAGESDVVVRVADADPARVKRVLDVGADGVMAPQIHTAADAEALVDAVRYPPEGSRGVAASRASDYGRSLGEYYRRANEDVAVLPQIESGEAVENAEAIASVDGVDALFLGPADLSADLDRFGEYEDPEYAAAVDRIVEAAERSGVPAGTLATTDDEIEFWHDRGFDFLIVGTDLGYLSEGAHSAKARYESLR